MATYKFDKESGLEIWLEGDGVASLQQPTWPDGTAWKTETEAVNWGKIWVASLEDPEAPRAGVAPDKHPEPIWADKPDDGKEYVQNWKTGNWDLAEEEPEAPAE